MRKMGFTGKWVIGLMLIIFQSCNSSSQEVRLRFENKFPIEVSVSKGIQNDLIIYLTGDGGWNRFSQKLVHEFEEHGYGVVSLNSLKYFKDQKSPAGLASDLESLSEYYLKEWHKTSLIIVGYSFGADVASFLPGNLASNIKAKVKKVALLSPSASTDFVVRLGDLLGIDDNEKGKFKVGLEIEKSQLPIVCIFGEKESLLLKKSLKNKDDLSVYELPGGHQFDDNFNGLVQIIIS